MYEAYYGFREKPFSLVPDPDFLYLGRNHRAALNILEYGLRGEASFALISGEVGSGKTILIRRFLRMVDQQTTIGLITNTHASLGNLLDWILLAFNLDYRGKEKVELFEILTNFLLDQRARGRRTVLIIDEAQNMEFETLEELRMLSNINVDKDLMFQIVLAGQPEILDKINRPELRQLAQRISANFHLSPLTLDETRDYICHRLAVAGGRRGLFDNLACAAVYHFTDGLPRPINILCDSALVYGFGEGVETISLDTILDVVEDVQRSGLRALRVLEGGFDREKHHQEITALAQTYVNPEPPEEDPQQADAPQAAPSLVGPADRETRPAADLASTDRPLADPGVAKRDLAAETKEPSLAGEDRGATREVPSGIPPLIGSGDKGDGWRAPPKGKEGTKSKRWRRLFDAAAAAVLALALTATLLHGLGIWSDEPSEPAVETAEPSEEPTGKPDTAVTIILETDRERTGTQEAPSDAESEDDTAGAADREGSSSGEAETTEPAEDEKLQTAALSPSTGSGSEKYWVRLGMFRQLESAPIQWRQLQRSQSDLLSDLSHEITKVERQGLDPFYLLKAGPLPDAATSEQLCRQLTDRGVDCLALHGGPSLAVAPQAAPEETQAANLPEAETPQGGVVGKNADLYKLALVHSQDGQTFSKSGDYDRAIQEFNAAIRLDPSLASAHYNRGELHFRKGDYKQAIRDFSNTIRLAPDYTFAYYSRGVANEKIGEVEEAILDYTHTVRLKPSYAPAYNDRARALLSLGHLREALRDSELAISVAPDTPTYLATHSQILAALGRGEGAFATLDKAMAVADAEWIKRYQQAMSRDGYYRGPIDGQYGPATKSAMRACLDSGCSLASWN